MTIDVTALGAELESAAIASPLAEPLAIAVVSDVLRAGGLTPPSMNRWRELLEGKHKAADVLAVDLRGEQLGMLAHALQSTGLGAATAEALRGTAVTAVAGRLETFFGAIFPLTAEMIRSNRFRREEFLRRWAETWGIAIAGEDAAVAQKRLEQLDYRKALSEYQRAEKARAEESQRRAEALRKAQEEAEAAARGWRE